MTEDGTISIREVWLEYVQYYTSKKTGMVDDGPTKGMIPNKLILKLTDKGEVIISPSIKASFFPREEVLRIAHRAFHHRVESLPWDCTTFEDWKTNYFDKQYPE